MFASPSLTSSSLPTTNAPKRIAESGPLGKKLAIRRENLYAVIATIGDKHASVVSDGDAVGSREFARGLSLSSPCR